MRTFSRLFFATALTFVTSTVSAQNCAGFTDVLTSSGFCDNIQWIKNRGVTGGCSAPPGAPPGATYYCPSQVVSRDQMAAFMNRLGRALTPAVLYAQADTGPITLPGDSPAAPELRCITADSALQVATAQHARQVSVTATISGLADGAGASWRAFPLVSTDGGVTWSDLNPGNSVGIRTSTAANLWSVAAVTERMDLPPGGVYRFALGLRRDNVVASSGNLGQGRCQLAAVINNRNPLTAPF